MRSLLRTIRSKPKSVRDRYALLVSLGFTGMVALVWGLTGMNLDQKTVTDVAQDETTPFANLTKQIKEQWAVAQGSLDKETATTTEPAVVTNPTELIISEETKVEIASGQEGWSASSTTVSPEPELVIVQIATSSQATTTSSTSSVR